MIKNTLLALLGGAFISGAALGGEWCPPVSEKSVVECDACPDYNGSISAGYHSDYIWRGYQFAEENWTADINYTLPLADALGLPFGDLNVGVWYLQGLPGTYEETNIYASVAGPTVVGFDTSLTYTNYRISGLNDTSELAATIGRELGGAYFSYTAAHDFDLNTWYHELSMARSIPLTDDLSLELLSAAGYWDAAGFRGFAHRTTTLSLPIQCGCQLTITPYVGYIDSNQGGPTHAANPGTGSHTNTNGLGFSPDDQWFGGVTVGWAF